MAQALGHDGQVVQHAFAAPQAHQPVVGQDDARAIPTMETFGNARAIAGVYCGV